MLYLVVSLLFADHLIPSFVNVCLMNQEPCKDRVDRVKYHWYCKLVMVKDEDGLIYNEVNNTY